MNFVVIGAGAWGTAMAIHLSRLNHTVTLVPRRFEQALELGSIRENREYLPGCALPASLQIGFELTPVLMEAEVVLLACPSHSLRETCRHVRDNLGQARQLRLVLSLAKGLEPGKHLRPCEIIQEILPAYEAGCLTGPTNAAGVAKGLPAAMVMATNGDRVSAKFLSQLQAAMSNESLRIYLGDDVAGAEFGGCLKNIYAIAAGCCDGLKLGDNAKAALLTRALAEMVRVGVALGAKPETFYGLGGFGDLVATCNGIWSRNRTFGQRIGEGRTAEALIAESRSVVEGYRTTKSFFELCQAREIDAPILAQVFRILYEKLPPAEALRSLMTRELKKE